MAVQFDALRRAALRCSYYTLVPIIHASGDLENDAWVVHRGKGLRSVGHIE
jgi:hypothetical protein